MPVYWMDDLLMAGNSETIISPGRDYGHATAEYHDYGIGRIDLLLYRLPTEAIRTMSNGDYIYFVYDTDEGQRVYLFTNREDGGGTEYHFNRLSGLAVIMAKTLAYETIPKLRREWKSAN